MFGRMDDKNVQNINWLTVNVKCHIHSMKIVEVNFMYRYYKSCSTKEISYKKIYVLNFFRI